MPSVADVRISHPDKVLFPEIGLTKAELVAHYVGVADRMLPHVRDRPLSLQVYPGGIEARGHFLKQVPDYFPPWVKRVTVPKKGGTVTHVIANDAATLALLANHNAITPHVWTSRRDRLDRPDRLIVDLDPPDEEHWAQVLAGARVVGELMRAIGLEPFAMVTGSRGLHVVAPLRREVDFPDVFELSKQIALRAVDARPDELTTEFHKTEREDRVFVDVLRNRRAQTAVAPYGVRARAEAPVATPLRWEELDDTQLGPRRWTVRSFLERGADPWERIGDAAASPRGAARRLRSLA